MLFRHAVEDVEHAPRHQPEIAGIDRHVGIADALHQPVEQSGRAALEHGLAFPLTAEPIDDVGFGAVHQPPHLGKKLRRILQVGIDGEDALAPAGI